jgi:hypothetical protein
MIQGLAWALGYTISPNNSLMILSILTWVGEIVPWSHVLYHRPHQLVFEFHIGTLAANSSQWDITEVDYTRMMCQTPT